MPVMYEVNGYDRSTDDLAWSLNIPYWRAASVLRTAGVPDGDDGLGSYPLDLGQLDEIASLVGAEIPRRDLQFFLEPFEAPPQKAA